ncbi:putative Protein kinase domain [Paratrimastix pyriformis]|uniref:Protein kinase domain-containing protein n=1 Tax=Paratrimastix pyriformis TaxID=342808 RepID=A0ABQ8UEU0_9EUKA|nr:putative Protein kinase domain [Paratrimastix pyriformis]
MLKKRRIGIGRGGVANLQKFPLKHFVCIRSPRRGCLSLPVEVTKFSCGDIVFVSDGDTSENPWVVPLNTPRAPCKMPRRLLEAVSEPEASQYREKYDRLIRSSAASCTSVRPATATPVQAAPSRPAPSQSATTAPAAPAGSGAASRASVRPATATPVQAATSRPAPSQSATTAPAAPAGYKVQLFAGSSETFRPWVLAQDVQTGRASLLLYALVGDIYQHTPPRPAATTAPAAAAAVLPPPAPAAAVLPPPASTAAVLPPLAPDGRPLTRSCWVLGAGTYGMTFKMDNIRDHKEVVLKATLPRTPAEVAFFNNESFIACSVHHPNVLSAAGPAIETQILSFHDALGKSERINQSIGGCLFVWVGGDLDAFIRRDPAADRTERWWLLVDMVNGLAYLHGKPFPDNECVVLHNDIKPANVLLRRQFNPEAKTVRLVALLADLGLACVHKRGSLSYGLCCCGTPGFMAPELFPAAAMASGQRPSNTPATDVYGLGVTLYCLYTKTDTAHKTEERPSAEDLREAFAEVGEMEAAAGCPARLVELLVRMCSGDPTERPSIQRVAAAVQAVVHPGTIPPPTPTPPVDLAKLLLLRENAAMAAELARTSNLPKREEIARLRPQTPEGLTVVSIQANGRVALRWQPIKQEPGLNPPFPVAYRVVLSSPIAGDVEIYRGSVCQCQATPACLVGGAAFRVSALREQQESFPSAAVTVGTPPVELKPLAQGQGLFHYIGTQGSTQPYVNPAKQGWVTITRSSVFQAPGVNPGEPFNVLDREWGSVTAQRCEPSWHLFDLGTERLFTPTHLSISMFKPRPPSLLFLGFYQSALSELQSSLDGATWSSIFSPAHTIALLERTPVRASRPARYFRVMGSRDAGGVCGFELFGTLYTRPETFPQ